MSRLAIAVASAFLVVQAAQAQEGGRITRVMLHPGSATVERSAPVVLGQTRLELTGLPANFDPRTLRVEADAGIRIGEIAVRDVARTESAGARESQLEARIQALKDQQAALDVEAKSAELVRDFLATLKARPEGEKAAPLDPKSIPVVLDAIKRGGGDAFGTLHRVSIRKREMQQQLSALERDLARLKGGARDTRTLALSLSASRPGEVRASYQVAGAGWKPAYRAGLDSAASRIELERVATVTQRTGEDWSGVSLRLSTGQPRAATIVDPQTWQLVIQSPRVMEDRPAAAAGMMARSADRLAEQRAAAPAPVVTEFQSQYATEFEVPGRVDIASDGRVVSVSLTKQVVAVKQTIRVVPRRDAAAMVTAEAERPEGVWLAGDVQLYRDGAYIGSTWWNAQAKDKLMLPFGRDDRVQVSTSRVKDRSGTNGVLSRRNERQIADLYTITSKHKVPVELLVLEASPVAVNDQIEVSAAFEPKPKLTHWEDRQGVVAWQRSLAPNESLKFVADYTITYPKDAAVAGLP